jgi:ppGpp synthetase/RelA/SpoT-type nucleotidyltranferase
MTAPGKPSAACPLNVKWLNFSIRHMDIIARFIERYRREFDFFDQTARLAQGQLDGALASSGIQAMVTYRAKRPDRLEQKLRHRNKSKAYADTQDIYTDIADFSGVRVALYFPGARAEVDKVIRANFEVEGEPKTFPQTPQASTPTYDKRFSGYWATHYRVRLRDGYLQETQRRYSEASIEIQVASVLMHAWSEVEHDLVYKPLQGSLSEDEYAILDELNGLVLAGEIALERLQRAIAARVTREGIPFTNHYELASFLQRCAAPILKADVNDSALGRVDALYELLVRLQLNTPEHVRPLISLIHPDVEKRTIADQLVDQVVESNPDRYRIYGEVRHKYEHESKTQGSNVEPLRHDEAVLGTFMRNWIELERHISIALQVQGLEGPQLIANRSVLEKFVGLEPDMRREIDRIRMIRNRAVHGSHEINVGELKDATRSLRRILRHLKDGNEPMEPTAA